MKAMILAAGMGSRLRPFTYRLPKPLFPVAGQSVLDRMIMRLYQAGCRAIIINTHHLYPLIERHIKSHNYPLPIYLQYEKKILGTGGAIKNVAAFWEDAPFMVVNSDIITDIDLKAAYQSHIAGAHKATLVLHDREPFNTVWLDSKGMIVHFNEGTDKKPESGIQKLAFTGIQVITPALLNLIPKNKFFSIIDVYRQLIASGKGVHSHIADSAYWQDIGTAERLRQANLDILLPKSFAAAHGLAHIDNIRIMALKGDGSERRWFRLKAKNNSLIMVDHGIQLADQNATEAESFVHIGNHLYRQGIHVPKIIGYDIVSGLVITEDLGDRKLQHAVLGCKRRHQTLTHYRAVIREMVKLHFKGGSGFDPKWTCQTPNYSKDLIIHKECRYFIEAFVQGYLGQNVEFEPFLQEFDQMADRAIQNAYLGLIHRDLQSRNIMLKGNKIYFIDFQGARMGPFQYDLASLLIDPYTALSAQEISVLAAYAKSCLSKYQRLCTKKFNAGFTYCALTRNLQILGAFGFLSHKRSKPFFEDYIPPALLTLKRLLGDLDQTEFPRLLALVNRISRLKRFQ